MRALFAGLFIALAWAALAAPQASKAPMPRLLAPIGPMPVSEALANFTRQTGLQLIYVSSDAETQHSRGARAGLSAPEALRQLLDGTGLEFDLLNARTVRIYSAPTVVPAVRTSSRGLAHSAEASAGSRAFELDEVVITGTRGQDPVSKVPMDIKLWTGEAIDASDIKGMTQLGALSPGVGFAASPALGGDAYTHLDIRGVTSRFGATVGAYLGDTPIPPARAATYLLSFPLTFDLDLVEMLSGPQTVLLGDHTQAGAIRFIPTQPSVTTSTGLLRAQWGTTEYGGRSYEAGAAVGGPLFQDVLGFRLAGWRREDGGYVDRVDPVTGFTVDANANSRVSEVVRGALTIAPTDSVQITPSLTYQSIRSRDTSTIDSTVSSPGRGIFKNTTPVQQPFEDTYYLGSVKLTARLRAGDFSLVASYFSQLARAVVDLSSPEADYFGLHQRAYSADVRLGSHDPHAALTWITGIFFSDEHVKHPYWPSGVYGDTAVTDQNRLELFGQIARTITRRLTVTAGVRVGHSNYHYFDDLVPLVQGETPDTWYAPRLGFSWQVDEANLVYLTVAKGYGSPGFYPFTDTPTPADTLWSYEIGSKHGLADGRLQLETSIFRIEWDNGPPNPEFLGTEHTPVAGRAVSHGLKFTAQGSVTDHFKSGLCVSHDDAHVVQTLTLNGQVYVQAGASLPVSPWNVTSWAQLDFPILSKLKGSLRVEDAYGSAPGSTYLSDPTSVYYNGGQPGDPSMNALNMRAAVTGPRFEVAALLRNALNSHPFIIGSANGVDTVLAPTGFFTLVPRTLSVSVTWRF